MLGREMDETLRHKVENDAWAGVRTIVQKRGRNLKLAEEAVLEAKAFTEKEALDNDLIDFVASSEPELFEQLNGREIQRFDGTTTQLALASPLVVDYQKTVRESFISAIAASNLPRSHSAMVFELCLSLKRMLKTPLAVAGITLVAGLPISMVVI